ncbi:protein adenylyltransferase SelO [Comamonas sp. B21-038]|uniref:protein adenylyltransferase SelO n=1 Tax=Comamonas sp. B21-038 TaxID=2918299 RepID=UPI001EFA5636|nr:YdiU family protein [Comamonas sp. B21-038]ULR90757.1 YdiU family protein [Comamonas sp. B21-038]
MSSRPAAAAGPASTPAAADSALQPGAQWHNGFAGLPPVFYTRLQPTPMPALAMHARNDALAQQMGLRPEWLRGSEATEVLGGNALLPGMDALASVYSGHQFGHWAGQLGDGRAILLGEIRSPAAPQGLELQLKGAGKTPYSRMGDGRAVLRSSIREYLCSEAMHGLGVPTTRALSLVTSPQPIYRETVETAAVVARVAPSFVRFGHFEHFAARDDQDSLRKLADYVVERYMPDVAQHASGSAERYAAFLAEVAERTARMIALWQAHGFCHGVMNTDNMSILGLTIDYGPFQFLDHYDANHICNHSDTGGRYAFARQPQVAYWNLFCLGQALLPLIGDEATTLAALERYKTALEPAMQRALGAKLGLDPARSTAPEAVAGVVNPLLALMQQHRTDYSLFWRALSQAVADDSLPALAHWFDGDTAFETWREQYQALLQPGDAAATAARMFAANPRYVLRNHLGQQAITAAQQGDWAPFARLQTVLATPYAEHPGCEDLAALPPDWAQHIEISCSS